MTHSLTGANAGLFDVDASNGQVKTKGSLNYEAASTYTVAFTASDPQSNSASIALNHHRNRHRYRGAWQTSEAVHLAESRHRSRSVEGRVGRS